MAKLRKFSAYRRIERPYTRTSKFRKKAFVRTRPPSKIVRFEMGNPKGNFNCTVDLVSRQALQIRHNAIESARQSSNKILEQGVGKSGYFMKIRIYPHHILRENPLASGAGADRMSTGMQLSFGKPIGSAAQVKIGQTVVSLRIDKQHLPFAREALKRYAHKLPGTYRIRVEEAAAK
jgi:large subunit ribosomal protein L10e